jgi:hypothetical protein
LKSTPKIKKKSKVFVAPYIGAWIEVPVILCNSIYTHVAPYIGAWIEVKMAKNMKSLKDVAERGLKF